MRSREAPQSQQAHAIRAAIIRTLKAAKDNQREQRQSRQCGGRPQSGDEQHAQSSAGREQSAIFFRAAEMFEALLEQRQAKENLG